MQEFKVGDRVLLEGVITTIPPSGGYFVTFGGSTKDIFVTREKMNNATLIEPELKDIPQRQVMELDLNKPMRFKNSENSVRYIGELSNGRIVVEPVSRPGVYADFYKDELENIPEPKKITEQTVYLYEDAGCRFFSVYTGGGTLLSEARISYTDDEGWSIKEVK